MKEEKETEIYDALPYPPGLQSEIRAAVWSGDILSTSRRCGSGQSSLNIRFERYSLVERRISAVSTAAISIPRILKELIVRWFQFGVFCPLFPSAWFPVNHVIQAGDMLTNEAPVPPMKCGLSEIETTKLLKIFSFLRQRLLPYVDKQ